MLHFDITIHARPRGPQSTRRIEVGDRQVQVVDIAADLLVDPLPVTFEQAAASLERLPLLFFEPDGSFVWGRGAQQDRWEIDGLLYEGRQRLQYVSLRGRCPRDAMAQLLASFGWPEFPLIIQLNQQGVFVDADEFQRLAE